MSNPAGKLSLLIWLALICLLLGGTLVVQGWRGGSHTTGGHRLPTIATTSAAERVAQVAPPVSPPPILSRRAWSARQPIRAMKRHTIACITLHHTAEKQQPKVSLVRKMRGLQAFSQSSQRLADGKRKPAWADVPYHYYIDVNGQIAEGRLINFAGDTNTGYDPTGHAFVVLEGNFEIERPTPKQLISLNLLLRWLMQQYHVPAERIKGHRDYAATACPGKYFIARLPQIRRDLIADVESKRYKQ